MPVRKLGSQSFSRPVRQALRKLFKADIKTFLVCVRRLVRSLLDSSISGSSVAMKTRYKSMISERALTELAMTLFYMEGSRLECRI